MSVELGSRQLVCGRSVEGVLTQVAEDRGAERDSHQRQCPHCQAALGEYDRLWTPIRELAAETVSPPQSIVDSVLRQIRGAAEYSNYGVVESPNGLTRISARVVVVTARETAQAVPGVRVALSKRITSSLGYGDDSPGGSSGEVSDTEVTAGIAGRSTAVEITLAADYGLDLRRLGERVCAEVSARIRALTDLEPVQVTVIIDDVFG
jgi:uncharacterized alkaline shock family protein YloU